MLFGCLFIYFAYSLPQITQKMKSFLCLCVCQARDTPNILTMRSDESVLVMCVRSFVDSRISGSNLLDVVVVVVVVNSLKCLPIIPFDEVILTVLIVPTT
jgi:hypothetical protein